MGVHLHNAGHGRELLPVGGVGAATAGRAALGGSSGWLLSLFGWTANPTGSIPSRSIGVVARRVTRAISVTRRFFVAGRTPVLGTVARLHGDGPHGRVLPPRGWAVEAVRRVMRESLPAGPALPVHNEEVGGDG